MTRTTNSLIDKVKRTFGLRDTIKMQKQYKVMLPLNRIATPLDIMNNNDWLIEDDNY